MSHLKNDLALPLLLKNILILAIRLCCLYFLSFTPTRKIKLSFNWIHFPQILVHGYTDNGLDSFYDWVENMTDAYLKNGTVKSPLIMDEDDIQGSRYL